MGKDEMIDGVMVAVFLFLVVGSALGVVGFFKSLEVNRVARNNQALIEQLIANDDQLVAEAEELLATIEATESVVKGTASLCYINYVTLLRLCPQCYEGLKLGDSPESDEEKF